MKITKSIFIFLYLLIANLTGAQVDHFSDPIDLEILNYQIDSLQKILQIQKEDTGKVAALNEIGVLLLQTSDIQNALQYANRALALADKIDFKSGKASAYKNIGQAYLNLYDYTKSRKYLFLSVEIYKEINDRERAGDANFLVMLSYHLEGNYPEELRIGYENIKIYEALGDKTGVAKTFVYIADTYHRQDNISGSVEKFTEALQLFKETGMKLGIAICYFSIAELYLDQGKYAEALSTDSASILIYREIGHKAGLAESLSILAYIYHNQGKLEYASGNNENAQIKFNEALKNYFEALKLVEEIGGMGGKGGISWTNVDIGEVYLSKGNYKKARDHFVKGLAIAKEIKSNERLKISYNGLARLDSATGNFKLAYDHYKLYILYRDSLINEENTRKSEGYKMQYEFDKKEDQIKLLSAQNKLQTALVQQQSQRKNFAYAGIGVILLAGGYGFYRFRKRKKLQSQQALMTERFRISRELHDEVGATLSGIAMYSHLTKEQIKNANTLEVEKSLNIMQQSAGEMVNKLNDIVWLINPDQDSLQKLIQRLEEYARDMAAIKNMQVKVNVPEHLHEHSLPMESRRNIYLFCKEAINNAVKYSNGTLLELTIKEVAHQLEFSVSDNGKGFDAVMVRRGNGLENMQKRADEVGAKLTVQSKQGEGSLVSMQIKIT